MKPTDLVASEDPFDFVHPRDHPMRRRVKAYESKPCPECGGSFKNLKLHVGSKLCVATKAGLVHEAAGRHLLYGALPSALFAAGAERFGIYAADFGHWNTGKKFWGPYEMFTLSKLMGYPTRTGAGNWESIVGPKLHPKALVWIYEQWIAGEAEAAQLRAVVALGGADALRDLVPLSVMGRRAKKRTPKVQEDAPWRHPLP